MEEVLGIRSSREIREYAEAFGYRPETLSATMGGRELLVIRAGGDRLPSVLITAGSHAPEPAGVLAGLQLLRDLRTDHAVYYVPTRDPAGFDGYAAYLQIALGKEVRADRYYEVEEVLRSAGQVLHTEPGFTLVQIGELVFANMEQPPDSRGPMDAWKKVGHMLAESADLLKALAGRRLVLPAMLGGVDGCGHYTQAFTAVVTAAGAVANLNRLVGRPEAPVEVTAMVELADRVRPGLTLDLHEGQGDRWYLFVGKGDQPTMRVGRAMCRAVQGAGYRVITLDELAPRIGPELARKFTHHGDGILTGPPDTPGQGVSLCTHCEQYGPAFATETGRWAPLKERVRQQLLAAQSGLSEFSQMCREV